MNWSLEQCVKVINDLLWCQTHNELRARLHILNEQGISVGDDFVQTEDRRRELESIRNQLRNSEGPSVILTGWYGAGKSTVLRRIVHELGTGGLTYGALQVDPIEIQLNEQNTFSLFLSLVLENLGSKTGQEWLIEVYKNKRQPLGLPELQGDTVDSMKIALQELPIARMESVVEFLEEMFKEYKRRSGDKRVICLVFDELENISQVADKLPGVDVHNKLRRLLQIFLDNAVREYIDKPTSKRSPFLLIVFSVLEVAQLEKGMGLPQDTVDRCKSIHRDINLSPLTAEFLMKCMLRIYFTGILGVACKTTNDGRLLTWKQSLDSAEQIGHASYTYPVSPEVHSFISQRILVAAGHKGVIRRFRAYQVAVLELLRRWQGDVPIDVRFMIANSDTLRYALADYDPEGVDLRNIIDSTSIRDLVSAQFKTMKPGQTYEVARLTEAAITTRVTPVVSVNWKTVEALVGEPCNLSEAAFQETLRQISQANVTGWTIVGDTLSLEVSSIVGQLGTPARRITEEEEIGDLLNKTAPRRGSGLLELLLQSIPRDDQTFDRKRTYIDDNHILHVVSNKEAFMEEYLIALDGDPQHFLKIQEQATGMKPGILIRQSRGEVDGLPFESEVFLPKPLDRQQSKYGRAVKNAFCVGDLQERVFDPLINTLIKNEKLTAYQALQEAIKVVLVLEQLEPADRAAFRKYQILRPLLTLFLSPMELSPADETEWMCSRLGFSKAHQLDPSRRLIKILSWTEDQGSTSLVYQNSADVKAPIKGKIFEQSHLPAEPDKWRRELETEWEPEWFVQNCRLPAYPDWPAEIRDKYDRLNKEIVGSTMKFYDVGKQVFGQCPFHRVATAVAGLHLFLKIGHVSPLGWKLSDDVHESYASMTITPRDVLRESRLRTARSGMAQLKTESVVCYCALPDKESQAYIEPVEWLLDKQHELEGDPSAEKVSAVSMELGQFQRPALPKVSRWVDQQDSRRQRLAQMHPKLGEYLSQLDRICSTQNVFSVFVSRAAEPMIAALLSDTEYEYSLWRLRRLYSNWSKQIQDDCPSNGGLLKRVEEWYTQGLGSQGAWATSRSEEFVDQFQRKVVDIRRNHVAEDLLGMKEWVTRYIKSIIFENAIPTYNSDDSERIGSRLSVAQKEARTEIMDVLEEVRQALGQADQLEGDPVAMQTFRIQVSENRGRLRQTMTVLQDAVEKIFTGPFGQQIKSGKADVRNWDQLYAKIQQAKETRIRDWLEREGLSAYEELIVGQFGSVRRAIQDLDSEWLDSGVDVLTKLKKGPQELMAIVAASRLLKYLTRGEQ